MSAPNDGNWQNERPASSKRVGRERKRRNEAPSAHSEFNSSVRDVNHARQFPSSASTSSNSNSPPCNANSTKRNSDSIEDYTDVHKRVCPQQNQDPSTTMEPVLQSSYEFPLRPVSSSLVTLMSESENNNDPDTDEMEKLKKRNLKRTLRYSNLLASCGVNSDNTLSNLGGLPNVTMQSAFAAEVEAKKAKLATIETNAINDLQFQPSIPTPSPSTMQTSSNANPGPSQTPAVFTPPAKSLCVVMNKENRRKMKNVSFSQIPEKLLAPPRAIPFPTVIQPVKVVEIEDVEPPHPFATSSNVSLGEISSKMASFTFDSRTALVPYSPIPITAISSAPNPSNDASCKNPNVQPNNESFFQAPQPCSSNDIDLTDPSLIHRMGRESAMQAQECQVQNSFDITNLNAFPGQSCQNQGIMQQANFNDTLNSGLATIQFGAPNHGIMQQANANDTSNAGLATIEFGAANHEIMQQDNANDTLNAGLGTIQFGGPNHEIMQQDNANDTLNAGLATIQFGASNPSTTPQENQNLLQFGTHDSSAPTFQFAIPSTTPQQTAFQFPNPSCLPMAPFVMPNFHQTPVPSVASPTNSCSPGLSLAGIQFGADSSTMPYTNQNVNQFALPSGSSTVPLSAPPANQTGYPSENSNFFEFSEFSEFSTNAVSSSSRPSTSASPEFQFAVPNPPLSMACGDANCSSVSQPSSAPSVQGNLAQITFSAPGASSAMPGNQSNFQFVTQNSVSAATPFSNYPCPPVPAAAHSLNELKFHAPNASTTPYPPRPSTAPCTNANVSQSPRPSSAPLANSSSSSPKPNLVPSENFHFTVADEEAQESDGHDALKSSYALLNPHRYCFPHPSIYENMHMSFIDGIYVLFAAVESNYLLYKFINDMSNQFLGCDLPACDGNIYNSIWNYHLYWLAVYMGETRIKQLYQAFGANIKECLELKYQYFHEEAMDTSESRPRVEYPDECMQTSDIVQSMSTLHHCISYNDGISFEEQRLIDYQKKSQ